MLTNLVGFGFDEEKLVELDLISFVAKLDSVERVQARRKTEWAWTLMIAAQATSKDMKEWVKRWADGGEPQNDIAAFMQVVGNGV